MLKKAMADLKAFLCHKSGIFNKVNTDVSYFKFISILSDLHLCFIHTTFLPDHISK